MPVTSSAIERNGVDDGQAPAQIPHATQSSGITRACPGARFASVRGPMTTAPNGQSTKQRPQPLQFSGLTRATGWRGARTSHGSASVSAAKPATATHSAAGDDRYISG